MNGKLERSPPFSPYLGASRLDCFTFSLSLARRVEKISNLALLLHWGAEKLWVVMKLRLIAALHLFSPPDWTRIPRRNKKKRFFDIDETSRPELPQSDSVSGVARSTNSLVFVFVAIAPRQIIRDNCGCSLVSPPNDTISCPRDLETNKSLTTNNNLDNLDFQFTAINQFPANRHQQETNCSRRTRRRFEVGVGRQTLQVNMIFPFAHLNYFPITIQIRGFLSLWNYTTPHNFEIPKYFFSFSRCRCFLSDSKWNNWKSCRLDFMLFCCSVVFIYFCLHPRTACSYKGLVRFDLDGNRTD